MLGAYCFINTRSSLSQNAISLNKGLKEKKILLACYCCIQKYSLSTCVCYHS